MFVLCTLTLRRTLQLLQKTCASGLFFLKASAAVGSYSTPHLVTATPAWCMPSLRPPHLSGERSYVLGIRIQMES